MDTKSKFVPWNFDAPKGMREAIVSTYVPRSEDGTDKRYQKEFSALRSRAVPEHTKIADVEALAEAFRQAGVTVRSVQTAYEFNGQNTGNYWVIVLKAERYDYQTAFYISELGKFIACDLIWQDGCHDGPHKHFENLSGESLKTIALCRAIAETSGYDWLDADLLYQTVPGLFVWFYGVGEQSVRDLLFYWVD